MIRLILVYSILLATNSCFNKQSESSWLNVKPTLHNLPGDSITDGINLEFEMLNFQLPTKDTFNTKDLDSAFIVKYKDKDTLSFTIIKRDPQWLLKMLQQDFKNTNTELEKQLKQKKFKTDLEILDYIYNSHPKDNNPDKELIMRIKELVIPTGTQETFLNIKSSTLEGYQYGKAGKASIVLYDVYIDNHAYQIIAKGFDQKTLDKILGTFKLETPAVELQQNNGQNIKLLRLV